MATNDFICDLSDKMNEDGVEHLIIAIQKGDAKHSANAYFNIRTDDGAEMILATVDEIFKGIDEGSDSEMEIDPDSPYWPDDEPE